MSLAPAYIFWKSIINAIKRLQNVWKMHFVSRRKWLWNNLVTMRQQIAYSLFWKGWKKQNTQTIWEILAIGGTLGRQVGMCKTKVWTLHIFVIFFWRLFSQYEKFVQLQQILKNFRLFNNIFVRKFLVLSQTSFEIRIDKKDFILIKRFATDRGRPLFYWFAINETSTCVL